MKRRPDFILSNLVGESLHAFVSAFHALALEDERFSPERCPIVSCNMTEADIEELGATAYGHITTSSYFDGLDTPENRAFKARIVRAPGPPQGGLVMLRFSFTPPFRCLVIAIAEAGTGRSEDCAPGGDRTQLRYADRGALGPILEHSTQHSHAILRKPDKTGRFRLFEPQHRTDRGKTHICPVMPHAKLSGQWPRAEGAAGGLKVVK